MMLLRQLPTSSMSISMSSMAFPSFPDSLPSNSSILLSLLASLVVLSFVKAAILCLRSNAGKQVQKQVQVQVEGKAADRPEAPRQQRSSWAWGLLTWDNLPTISLPVSLSMADKENAGRGVGMREKSSTQWQPVRSRRGGPAFETPLPALYQSEEPVSMAKMIMSRHTYRRPTSRPPARVTLSPSRASTPPPTPTSTPPHPPSMV